MFSGRISLPYQYDPLTPSQPELPHYKPRPFQTLQPDFCAPRVQHIFGVWYTHLPFSVLSFQSLIEWYFEGLSSSWSAALICQHFTDALIRVEKKVLLPRVEWEMRRVRFHTPQS